MKFIILMLVCSLVANYVLVFIIIFVDATEIERYRESNTIKTKKQLFLYLIPYFLIVSAIVDFIKIVIKDFKEFYKYLA